LFALLTQIVFVDALIERAETVASKICYWTEKMFLTRRKGPICHASWPDFGKVSPIENMRGPCPAAPRPPVSFSWARRDLRGSVTEPRGEAGFARLGN